MEESKTFSSSPLHLGLLWTSRESDVTPRPARIIFLLCWVKYQLVDRIRKIIIVGKPKNIDNKNYASLADWAASRNWVISIAIIASAQ